MLRFLKNFFRLHREEFMANLASHAEIRAPNVLTTDEVRRLVREEIAAVSRLTVERGHRVYDPRI